MSQRERLLGRRIPPMRITIRVDFSAEADGAFAVHEAALRDLADAESRGADLVAERVRVEETRAALAPYREVLVVSPLPAAEYEDLIVEHPPTEAQRALGYIWNPDGFMPALLAACIGQDLPPEDRLSAKDWIDWATTAGSAAGGELTALFAACIRINDRAPDLDVGKG
jgi:hypothetical protein